MAREEQIKAYHPLLSEYGSVTSPLSTQQLPYATHQVTNRLGIINYLEFSLSDMFAEFGTPTKIQNVDTP